MSAPNGSVSSQLDGWLGPPTIGATNCGLWAGVVGGICHLPPVTVNTVSAMAAGGGGGGGGGGCSAYYGNTRGGGGNGSGGDVEGWDKHPGGTPGGGDKHPGGIPGGGGGKMVQPPWRHSRGGGEDGTINLVQPHYPP